jgi:hypothetical protein
MITYNQAKQLKELGFPQKKKRYSQYYLTENYVIDFESAHNIYMSNSAIYKADDEINWTDSLIYIPEFEDFIGPEQFQLTLDAYVHNYLASHKDVKENSDKLSA